MMYELFKKRFAEPLHTKYIDEVVELILKVVIFKIDP
jgi:hypothetical protein